MAEAESGPSFGNPSAPGGPSPRVLVVVLNWNGERDTIECLDSLARGDYPAQKIVVLDNGSRPGSVEKIEGAFPAVEVVRNGANLGYAAGNNVGLRLAIERGAGYCLVLNNDVTTAPDMVRLLVAAAERDPCLLVLGPRVYRADAPDQLFYPGWGIDWRRWLFHRLRETPAAGPDGLADAAFVQGCALMVRVDFLSGGRRTDTAASGATVDLLDERFYLYCEDADLAVRAQRAGGRTVEVAAARAWHKGYASSGRDSPMRTYYGWRNRWLFISKHATAQYVPRRHRAMLRAQLLLGDAGATMWRCVKARLRGDRQAARTVRALARAILDALRGRYGRGPEWL